MTPFDTSLALFVSLVFDNWGAVVVVAGMALLAGIALGQGERL